MPRDATVGKCPLFLELPAQVLLLIYPRSPGEGVAKGSTSIHDALSTAARDAGLIYKCLAFVKGL